MVSNPSVLSFICVEFFAYIPKKDREVSGEGSLTLGAITLLRLVSMEQVLEAVRIENILAFEVDQPWYPLRPTMHTPKSSGVLIWNLKLHSHDNATD